MMAFAYLHHSQDERRHAQLDEANWLAYARELQERVHQTRLDRRFARVVACVQQTQIAVFFEEQHADIQANPFTRERHTSLVWESSAGAFDTRPTLVEAIALAGIRPYRLAKDAGIDPKHIYRYVRCQVNPNTAVRKRIASALGLTWEQIRWPVRVRGGSPDDAA